MSIMYNDKMAGNVLFAVQAEKHLVGITDCLEALKTVYDEIHGIVEKRNEVVSSLQAKRQMTISCIEEIKKQIQAQQQIINCPPSGGNTPEEKQRAMCEKQARDCQAAEQIRYLQRNLSALDRSLEDIDWALERLSQYQSLLKELCEKLDELKKLINQSIQNAQNGKVHIQKTIKYAMSLMEEYLNVRF